jgi:sporulation-control protein
MVFKRLLQAVGVGGPAIDTVLTHPHCQPGQPLPGNVHLTGGETDAEIEHIALSLQTHVERGSSHQTVDFHRVVIASHIRLRAKDTQVIPFQIPLPWETPITDVGGQRLHGMNLGVRTEVSIAKAVDKGDLDPVFVQPLPSQQSVLEGFARLGFRFKSADLEAGRLHGVNQQLPFFQEIEFFPAPQFAGQVSEVELTMVANPAGLDIILEADKRGGMFTPSTDALGRIRTGHEEALTMEWAAVLTDWLQQLTQHRQQYMAQHGYGHPGQYGHRQSRGPGMGGVVAGAAAGMVGGMMIGDMLSDDEGFFGGDEE